MELVGRRFGHIRITDVIGQGGMGDVYAGYDEKLDRKVALKVLHAENRLDAESRERLVREARALSKLDHPHICRIFDYIESTDVDVLVLEFINGRTLQDVIYDEQTSRSEKLRIAISVAEVLVAAHRVGIVHRDLKPENVMLTKQGQVKVLDFGLARWLTLSTSKRLKASSGSLPALVPAVDKSDNLWFSAAPDSQTVALPQLQVVTYDSQPLQTAAGVTMGTPLYMSPEQARGEELTTASDMFAFGLLLQCLFTGGEPHPPGLTAREVILRAARGDTLAVQGVSGDVTALINSLKQYAPADRPTAIEALARLRALADKPRRIARRSAIAAAALLVILAGWRYTVDLARERNNALTARGDAERRRAQAEDLINFMIGDLRTKLQAVGRLDALGGASEKVLQYVGSSNKNTASVEELVAHSKALNQFGEVQIELGDLPAATKLFEQSFDRASTATQRDPRNAHATFALALSRFWLANSYRLRGENPRALEHARVYLALTSELAAREPTNEQYVLESAYAHSLNGMLLEQQRDFPAAISEYRTTLAIKQAYAARRPADYTAKEDLARTINKLGYALQKSGDLAGSRRHFEDEVALRQQTVAHDPKQMEWKEGLANAHQFLAYTLESLGEDESALRHRMAEVGIDTELAQYDPANTQWRRNLAIGRSRLGGILASRGELAQALQHLRAAETEVAALSASDPTRALWRNDLADVRLRFARVLLRKGDLAEARRKVDAALAAVDVRSRRRGQAYLILGNIRAKAGQAAEAREAWQQASELLRPKDVATAEVRELDDWARVLIALDQRAEATPVVQRLRTIGYRNRELDELTRANGY